MTQLSSLHGFHQVALKPKMPWGCFVRRNHLRGHQPCKVLTSPSAEVDSGFVKFDQILSNLLSHGYTGYSALATSHPYSIFAILHQGSM